MTLLSQAEQWCLQQGKQFTPLRKAVFAILVNADRSVKAYDILAELQKTEPNTAPMAIYRALDFLIQMGMVHKLESANAFVACDDFTHPHHAIMLICDDCHKVEELNDHNLIHSLEQAPSASGFKPTLQDIELKGVCLTCQSQRKDNQHA